MKYVVWASGAASILFAVLALSLLVRWRVERRRYAGAARHWVRTDALIQVCHMRVIPKGQTLTAFHRHPSVTYVYRAGGTQHTGRNPFLCRRPPFERQDEADAWLAAHAPGSMTAVWYDPSDPASSALALNPPDGADLLSTVVVLVALSMALATAALSA